MNARTRLEKLERDYGPDPQAEHARRVWRTMSLVYGDATAFALAERLAEAQDAGQPTQAAADALGERLAELGRTKRTRYDSRTAG